MAPEKTDHDDSGVSEDGGGVATGEVVDHDPYFEPVVTLPEVSVSTNEEEEEEMVRLRCKLFRYHTADSPAEWKERGTGDVKILKHPSRKAVRLLMRQDKTLKIRANHYITPYMELKPNCSSDRAWVWSVVADFADEQPKQELFAIRFANAENARLFRETFDEARGIVTVAEVKAREDEERKKAKEEEEEEEEEDTSTASSSTPTTPTTPDQKKTTPTTPDQKKTTPTTPDQKASTTTTTTTSQSQEDEGTKEVARSLSEMAVKE